MVASFTLWMHTNKFISWNNLEQTSEIPKQVQQNKVSLWNKNISLKQIWWDLNLKPSYPGESHPRGMLWTLPPSTLVSRHEFHDIHRALHPAMCYCSVQDKTVEQSYSMALTIQSFKVKYIKLMKCWQQKLTLGITAQGGRVRYRTLSPSHFSLCSRWMAECQFWSCASPVSPALSWPHLPWG